MDVIKSLTVQKCQNEPTNSLQVINNHWNHIPVFDPCNTVPENGKLYRFHGMIQDMPNPDIYFSKYEVTNTVTGVKELRSGKYLETLTCEENESLQLESMSCENGERRPYFMVPVPAVSDWVIEVNQNANVSQSLSIENVNMLSTQCAAKRTIEQMEVEEDEKGAQKRLCPLTNSNQQTVTSTPDVCNKTLNDKNIIGCLVMLYDVPESSIKLNEVLEVVGFLYSESMPVDEDDFEVSYKTPSPLTSRIHVVTFKKIVNANPLVSSVDGACVPLDDPLSPRADLLLVLTQMFYGDKNVALYVLCHLISQIYHRDESDVILGKFSLNVSSLPSNFQSKEFYYILKKILPKVQFLSLTVENLNKISLLPKKNYQTGRLESALLQLSDHTHLVIDELQLKEGKLVDMGVRNVNTLASLIKRQKLDYDFTYYTVGFATDIPVISLSSTKSILPSDIRCEISPEGNWDREEESFESVNQYLNENLLTKIRIYLSVAANSPCKIPDHFNEIVQEDFVKFRQEDPKFTAEDLHELLVVARFLTQSYCQKELTQDIWEEAKQMTIIRRGRLS